jgi:membrane fusion protein, multidrug efflux system
MASKKSLVKKKRFWIPTIVVLLGAAVVVGYWYTYLRGYITTDDAFVDGDPVSISSKITGRIVQLNAADGDTVTQGQLLVQLDDSDLRAQEAQAQAGLEYAQQSVGLAEVNLQKAQEDLNRSTAQFKESIIPQEQFDHAKRAVDLARAQKKVALAQVNNSQSQIEVIRTQLQNTKIVASSTGVVARKWVMSGDIIQPGQPVFTIYDLGNLWVTAYFEETKIENMKLGSPVEVEVDAYPNYKFVGKVTLIGAAAASRFSLIPPNNASGNFTKVTQRVPVKIGLDEAQLRGNDPDHRLLPGMSVEVKVKDSRY